MKTMQVRVPAEPVRCGSVVGGHRHRRGKARKAVAARDRIAAAACASRKPCRLNQRITRRRAVGGGMAAWPALRSGGSVTEQLLDLIQKNPRQRRDGLGPLSENPPQPLGQGDDPLPHGHRRDDVIDEVGRSLRHVPAVAGRAHTPPLAREGDDEPLRAPCAERAGEPKAEQPAREMPTKLLFDIEIGKPIVRAPRSVPRGLSARVFRACAVESGLDHSYEILNRCLGAESSLEESS